jgi:hypothetical protein
MHFKAVVMVVLGRVELAKVAWGKAELVKAVWAATVNTVMVLVMAILMVVKAVKAVKAKAKVATDKAVMAMVLSLVKVGVLTPQQT